MHYINGIFSIGMGETCNQFGERKNMGRVAKIVKIIIGVWLGSIVLSLLLLGFYNGSITEFINTRPRNIKVYDTYVSGDWRNYIEIQQGKYRLEVVEGRPRIGLRLVLKNTYTSSDERPSATLGLIPLNASGAELNAVLRVESQDRFNDFIRGQTGDTAIILFSGTKYSEGLIGINKDTSNRWVSSTRNFEVKTLVPRIVAIPELITTDDSAKNIVSSWTGAVTTGLLENKNIGNIVDQSRIQEAQRQLRFEAGDWSNPTKYAEIGRVLNVNTIAVGSVSFDRRVKGSSGDVDRYTLSLQLIDIATLSVIGAITINSTSTSNIRDAVMEMALQIR
jgi:hypothetical protein